MKRFYEYCFYKLYKFILSFTPINDIPAEKAAILLGLFTTADLIVLVLFPINTLPNGKIIVIMVGVLVMFFNLWYLTRKKYHVKLKRNFERAEQVKSFIIEKIFYYILIYFWLVGLVVFTMIANPGFKR